MPNVPPTTKNPTSSDTIQNASSYPAPSQRSNIDSFLVMDVMREAAKAQANGQHVIHMEVGQPSTPAPKTARQAVARALKQETLGYTHALGIDPLRERIARHYQETYGVKVSPDRIVVTSGSSAAFILAFLTVFDLNARVAVPEPGYPCYRQILKALEQTPIALRTSADDCWMPTTQQLTVLGKNQGLDGLILASPANPTGTMISPQRLSQLCEFCTKQKMWLISDEIYHGLTFDFTAQTALQFNENAIVINSFSKYYSMTGWRVGWMVIPSHLVSTVERLAQNFYISPPAVSQVAALAAFDGIDELEQNKNAYARNRDLLLKELPKLGFTKIAPSHGAFYLYCDISHISNNALELTKKMLDETGIATTPGADFDKTTGNNFIRFSFAGAHSDIKEAVRRLRSWEPLQRFQTQSNPPNQK